MTTFGLYYHEYFLDKILYRICMSYIDENVTIVELRYTFGLAYDDNQNVLTTEQQLAIFRRVEL